MPIIELLLLAPVVAVAVVAVVVWRRERPRPEPLPEEVDVVVDLTFLRAERPELDHLIPELEDSADGTLGARMRTAQLAEQATRQPTARTRPRRTRPLVASR